MNPVDSKFTIANNTGLISQEIRLSVYGQKSFYVIYHSEDTGRSFVVQQGGSMDKLFVYEIPATTATCFVEAIKDVFTITNLIGDFSKKQV